MQNRHSNSAESFQLLQLSDDSKTLSDLELMPEVARRKRKVRRKRKTNRPNNQDTDDYVKLNCKYVSIWMCVALTCAWLFSLSYMLAIVHSEYHELGVDIKKLSAFCSSMPETLQKLHESSKSLETNQTAISQKIYEVQQRIETVEKEFSQLKDSIRKGDGPDGDKAVDLKNTVAGFGAKIQALETDVKNFKDRFNGIQTSQQEDNARLLALQNSIESMKNVTQTNVGGGLSNETSMWVKNLTEHCSNDLKNVSDRLTVINDTLSQKVKSIDDEMHDHKTKLDGLNESFANVSSHVDSIEGEWPKFKQTNQQLEATVAKLNSDVISLKTNVDRNNAILAQQGANKQATSSAQDTIGGDSVRPFFEGSSNVANGLAANLNGSKVTQFPLSDIDAAAAAAASSTNATQAQPITPQQSNNSLSQAQTSSSVVAPSGTSSTTPATMPMMKH